MIPANPALPWTPKIPSSHCNDATEGKPQSATGVSCASNSLKGAQRSSPPSRTRCNRRVWLRWLAYLGEADPRQRTQVNSRSVALRFGRNSPLAAVPLCVRPHCSSSLIAVMWGVERGGYRGEVSFLKHHTACANLHAFSLNSEGCILNTMETRGAQWRVHKDINLSLFLHKKNRWKDTCFHCCWWGFSC